MSRNAKRYGMEYQTDYELEKRLRGIETALLNLEDANREASNLIRARAIPPSISGLSLVNSEPGQFTISWDPVSTRDFRKYEIQIATNENFSGATTFSEVISEFVYTQATIGITYYIRVRAINSLLIPGNWSGRLNATTGLVDTGDISAGALTAMTILKLTEGFTWIGANYIPTTYSPYTVTVTTPTYGYVTTYQTYASPPTSQIFQEVSISATANGIIIPYVYLHGELVSLYSDNNFLAENYITTSFLRRAAGTESWSTLESSKIDFKVTIPVQTEMEDWIGTGYPALRGIGSGDTQRIQINVPALPDIPGQGLWEYAVSIALTSTADSDDCAIALKPDVLEYRLFEYKV